MLDRDALHELCLERAEGAAWRGNRRQDICNAFPQGEDGKIALLLGGRGGGIGVCVCVFNSVFWDTVLERKCPFIYLFTCFCRGCASISLWMS